MDVVYMWAILFQPENPTGCKSSISIICLSWQVNSPTLPLVQKNGSEINQPYNISDEITFRHQICVCEPAK